MMIVKDTLNILSDCQENISIRLTEIYIICLSMDKTQKDNLKISRNFLRQTNRTNYPTDNTE